MFSKKECKRCGNKASNKYEFCPHCGNPFNKKYSKNEDFGMLGKDDREEYADQGSRYDKTSQIPVFFSDYFSHTL